jgi:voltage-gated potassium channel
MINEMKLERVRDHFNICGYGQVGRTVRQSVLQQAGIDRARGLCVVIDNDADNLYITVTAKALNPKLKVITRAGQERYAEAMRTSGADAVVIPEFAGGKLAGQLIQKYAESGGTA